MENTFFPEELNRDLVRFPIQLILTSISLVPVLSCPEHLVAKVNRIAAIRKRFIASFDWLQFQKGCLSSQVRVENFRGPKINIGGSL